MLLNGNEFVASMNSVVFIVNNVITRLKTILFDNFLKHNLKKLTCLDNTYYNDIL